ncbi:hypothetical protein M5E88_08515 [Akkermansia muciniphila]|nr:hypothetical protein M5E88_08515 [Akkermansia muciniphila]
MTAVQQRSALDWWSLFYQKAEGKRFLSALSGQDRQLADLLNSAKPVPNGWGRILLAACSLLPGQKGRYYSCKKMLAEHFSQVCPNGFQKKTLLWKSRLTHRRLPCKLPYPPIPDQ